MNFVIYKNILILKNNYQIVKKIMVYLYSIKLIMGL